MFAQAEAFQQVVVCLSVLRYIIASNCKRQKTDIAIEAEDFFCVLLNIVLGSSLKNLNYERPNHPAIDLGCAQQRLAVQVTATNDSSKIKDTLTSFFKEKLEKDYDELTVLILTSKRAYQSEFKEESQGLKRFQIWDIDDLLGVIESNKYEIDFKQIDALLRQELPKIVKILSPPESLLARVNALGGVPAVSAASFLQFVGATADESPAIKADVDRLFNVLRHRTYLALREYLLVLLHNARASRQYGMDWENHPCHIAGDTLIVDPRRIGAAYYVTPVERSELLADLRAAGLLLPIEGHPDYWMPYFASPGLDGNLLHHLRDYARHDFAVLRSMLVIPDFSRLDMPIQFNS